MTELATLTDDPLDPWLRSLRPTTAVFCRATVREPWGFRIEAREDSTFHVLTRGSAILEVDGVEEPLHLEAGDLVLLASGAGHQLRDRPSSPVRPLGEAVASGTAEGKVFAFGGDGGADRTDGAGSSAGRGDPEASDGATMVCGGCRLGSSGTGVSRALLPPIVRHRSEPALVRLMDRESEELAGGGEAVLAQILTLLVTQALRAHLADQDEARRRALLSPRLAETLAYIHDHLAEEIELDDLCSVAKLSRTALSERFREVLGVSPIRYLRLSRLSKAAELLRNGRSGLEKVARAVGYSSGSTFSRAFRREFGVSPGDYRRSS